ncbi:4-alpha-glucanotransferase [Roseomonas gilardii subsp. gilardii]|uniref:4-alpha-glucanotransferase n=1 Tax=Roseomonas gilardii TaxID=257708 RepID=UPI001FF7502F|nr:4-alpha-glucanotransferase [Roseomonas gilardii]UPG74077.1 4-alpha-glucanotransferase [Roseomonas gilardii subsp. gilardii]
MNRNGSPDGHRDELQALARAAGIATEWRDAQGHDQTVAPEAVRAVLAALDLPTGSPEQMREAREKLATEAALPPLCTATAGHPVLLGLPGEPEYRLELEDGAVLEGRSHQEHGLCRLPVAPPPGYHRLRIGGADTILAVAPPRCHRPEDALAEGGTDALHNTLHSTLHSTLPWGLTVQLYGLRRPGRDGLGGGGVGDFTALSQFVASAARKGAQAVAISPVHAQFSADPNRFSPYSPSSRLFLNVLHADPAVLGEAPLRAALDRTGLAGEFDRLEALDLVDWPAVARARLAVFRALFDAFPGDPAFDRFRAEQGEALESHARFEALHAHLFTRDPALWNWRQWPAEFRDPTSPAVAAFAQAHEREVAYHAFLQWIADRGLGAAQQAAREAGAGIGLVADLAVGTDGGGSHGWSRQRETLRHLTIGAPPDIFSPLGQGWGITAFSPLGLKQGGYGAFLEMLRAAMRHAGGVRIDHAMGLARLWVIPEGADPRDGAYLQFPADDMFRLVALESQRHRAIVVGEDLGTVPHGFRERLDRIGMLGMRVLWFEQGEGGGPFIPPREWSRNAAAMTTTHDLPTAVGWWRGLDIDWRVRLGLLGEGEDGSAQRAERDRDRAALWQAMRDSGAAQGDPPPPEDGTPVAEAAAAQIGRSACVLALLPVEDALALPEQPNLPGTTDQHPNWRRRLPAPADRVLDDPACIRRLAALAEARPFVP